MRRTLAAAFLLSACGVRLDEQLAAPPTIDAALPPDATTIDASAPPPTGPFGPATKILGLSSDAVAEDDVTLNLAETEVIFAVNVGGTNKELYSASRADRQSAWGARAPIASLQSPGGDSAARLSGDELTLFYGGVRGGASEDIWKSTRLSAGSPWQAPTRMTVESSAAIDRWYAPCGTRYLLVSDRTVSGDLDLYEGVQGAVPTRLSISTVGSNDISPYLTADCLSLYWSHDGDLYVAKRAGLDAAWQILGVATDLSRAGSSEQDPWMSADQHRMYFASNADGEFDLYLATR